MKYSIYINGKKVKSSNVDVNLMEKIEDLKDSGIDEIVLVKEKSKKGIVKKLIAYVVYEKKEKEKETLEEEEEEY